MINLGRYYELRDVLFGFRDNKLDLTTTLGLISNCDPGEIRRSESVVFYESLGELVLTIGGALRREVLGHNLNKIEFSLERKSNACWCEIKIWDNIHPDTTDKLWRIEFFSRTTNARYDNWWVLTNYCVLYGGSQVGDVKVSQLAIGEIADAMRATKSCLS